jgi:hypothetical protein
MKLRSASLDDVPHSIRLRSVDIDRARQYLAGVEKLAAEGRRSKDLQVLLTALRVMAMQARTVAELGVRS